MAEAAIGVVLCCAVDDEPLLTPLVQTLEREGLWVHVLAGIEEDARGIGLHMDDHPTPIVYAICATNNLSRPAQRRAEGLFGARKGPSHHLTTLDLQNREQVAVLKQLRQAVADVLKREQQAGTRNDPSAERVPLREIVEMTHITAVGQSPPSAIPVGIDPLEDSTQRDVIPPKAKLPPRKPPPPEPEQVLGIASPSPAPAQRSSNMLVIGLVAVALAAVVLTLMLYRPDRGEPTRKDLPEKRVESTKAEQAKVEPAKIEPAKIEPTKTELVKEDPTKVAPTVAEPPSETPEPPVTPPDPGTDQLDEASAADEALAIGGALADGRLRSLDDVLFIPPGEHEMAWNQAWDHCKTRSVAGVSGFSLASLPSLKRLRSARLLDKQAVYWSATLDVSKGTGKDHVRVVDLVEHKIATRSIEESGIPLCVRKRKR